MRVGLANPFAYRPHVAHMVFLDRQLERLGHQTFFLGCTGRLADCASKVSKKGVRKQLECIKCRAGSVRSYLNVRPASVDANIALPDEVVDLARQWSYSTVCTVLQVEHESEMCLPEFRALQDSLNQSVARAYLNARRWIAENRLDVVFVFNGRYDLTRAIVEACLAESVPFVSVERSWFGEGLQLLPQENCLGLRSFHALCAHWAAKPLSFSQAARASALIRRRLTRSSTGEWRQYNVGTRQIELQGEIKYLFLPSSQHEWLGDPDRQCGWNHPVEGLEYLFARLGLDMRDLVVRAHPGWGMKIKNYGRNRANTFYRDWTRRVGAQYIEPSADMDTHSLIRSARVVLLNGSSASMEAAWLGKPVISLVPAAYTSSGISVNLFGKADVERVVGEWPGIQQGYGAADRLSQCRHALRFIYCANFRIMQFVDSMKADAPSSFQMIDPTDLSGLESLVTAGVLREDDSAHAADDVEETQVAQAILAGDFPAIESQAQEQLDAPFARIERRGAYRLIDTFFT